MATGRFQGKTVLVTGAGRGFGAVLANAFAREGADVIVHYNSSSAGRGGDRRRGEGAGPARDHGARRHLQAR